MKKALKTLLILIIAELFCMYVIKLFMPNLFIMAIANENILKIGEFFDNNLIVWYGFSIITTFITNFLIFCASNGKWKLNWKIYILIIIFSIISFLIEHFLPNYSTFYYIIYILALATLCKCDLKQFTIVYSTHIVSQMLSINIRGLSSLLLLQNMAVHLLLGFESYLWLIALYLYFNIKGKEGTK